MVKAGKPAERVANSMAILTSEGCYTGGGLAYGYKYIRTGRTNKRKQEVNDLAIREDEAEVVRIMFTKARYEGYGSQRVANYLTKNGIKNREGKNWHPSTIKAILRNPLYIGIMRSGATRSPVQEHLRIIDDETFYVVQANLVPAQICMRTSRIRRSLLAVTHFCPALFSVVTAALDFV